MKTRNLFLALALLSVLLPTVPALAQSRTYILNCAKGPPYTGCGAGEVVPAIGPCNSSSSDPKNDKACTDICKNTPGTAKTNTGDGWVCDATAISGAPTGTVAERSVRLKCLKAGLTQDKCSDANMVLAPNPCVTTSEEFWLDPKCKEICKALPGKVSDGVVCGELKAGEGGISGSDGSVVVELQNPIGVTSVPQLVGRIVDTLLGVLGAGALLMFVYGGLLWLISGGSADRIKKGKSVMVWATLGLALVFASAGLVRFTLYLFGAGG